ncbi:MAG: YcxB family protein [Flavobacterium sp.]|uniref:YcxB family protein n=1 Tax=Flavobacterium sp. TaxID=239 RepID=UPI0026114F32|nr:YcxB family protein [Flavobacterium sp.]MDD5150374.1 YcxB family protein [Flavobacterium sp.]
MTDIKYKLTEDDFLQLNLYHFDVEGSLRKNSQKIIFIFLSIIAILIAISIYKNENLYAITLVSVAFFLVIFHKRETKKKFEKIFKKNIQPYKNRFDKLMELKFTETEIEVKSVAGNAQFYNSQIKSIIETKEYFFIRLQPEAIIIPKREFENTENICEYLKSFAKKLNVEYKENFEWKW